MFVASVLTLALGCGQVLADPSPTHPAQQISSSTAGTHPPVHNFAGPAHLGLADPLSNLRRRFGLFPTMHRGRADSARTRNGPRLIALPKVAAGEQALARTGGMARIENHRSRTTLLGLVESWSYDGGSAAEGDQRTAIFGAERDLDLERSSLTLQSELALRDGDVARAGRSGDTFGNLGYSFRLAGQQPSGSLSYGLAFDYAGASLRPEDEDGDELRVRLRGGWELDESTRLSGHVGHSLGGLGTPDLTDSWSGGLSARRQIPTTAFPGLAADIGIDFRQRNEPANGAASLKTKLRVGLDGDLAPRLRGRVAVITETERKRPSGDERNSHVLRLRLQQTIPLSRGSARLGGETSLRRTTRDGAIRHEAIAGLSFTLEDEADSLSLHGRLVGRVDRQAPRNSGLGEELKLRFQHRSPAFSAGIEAALTDPPADNEALDYRAGLFVKLPF